MLNITEIRIRKINKGDLLAVASIQLDNCFVVRDIKLLDGKNGRYIGMPNILLKNGRNRRNYMFPLNNETRLQILNAICEEYDKE